MSERSGSIRKREGAKGATWQVVLRVGLDPATGKRVRRVHSGYKTEREARAALRRFLVDLEDRTYVEPSKVTVGHFLLMTWLPAHRREVRANTLANYEVQLSAYILPHIGQVSLQDLGSPHLSALYALLIERGGKGSRPLAPKTVRNVHLLLHRAFADAVSWDLRKNNPATGAKPPSARRARKPSAAMDTWTPSQVARFLSSVGEDRLAVLWRLVFFNRDEAKRGVGDPMAGCLVPAGNGRHCANAGRRPRGAHLLRTEDRSVPKSAPPRPGNPRHA